REDGHQLRRDAQAGYHSEIPTTHLPVSVLKQNLARLELEGTSLSHTDMQSVVHVKSLRSLNLGNTPIGDSEVSKIALLDNLRELRIGHTRVTIGGVRQLYRNKNL